jgi:hypothetical protein
MVLRIKPLDLSKIQTGAVRRRPYRLAFEDLAGLPDPQQPLSVFYRSLPRTGESVTLLDAAEMLAQTIVAAKPVIWIIDGLLLDAGLSALLSGLMHKQLVQGLVLSGEAALQDFELAFHGITAEDPAAGMQDGLLGLARETAEVINGIINDGVKRGYSIGECLGRGIRDRRPRHFQESILATGVARLIPTTVHVSVGADGFHRYPGADGAMLGKGTLKDMFMLSSYLSTLPPGGLIIATHHDGALNQVFLHAMALARNLNDQLKGYNLLRIGTSEETLLSLPGLSQHLSLPGPLEIMLPLLMGALFSLVE